MIDLIKLTHPVGQTIHPIYVNPAYILYIDDCGNAMRKGCNLVFTSHVVFIEESAADVLAALGYPPDTFQGIGPNSQPPQAPFPQGLGSGA